MFAIAYATLLLQGDLKTDLSFLLSDPAISQASVGVFVKQINGNPLFRFGDDKRLIPASNVKLFTAALAWNVFASSDTVSTKVWRVGNSVYLKGGGDPSLSIDEISQLRNALEVTKNDYIYFDDTLFGPEVFNPSWQIGDIEGGEAQAVSALTVNRGVVEVWYSKGKIILRPTSFGLNVKSKLMNGPDKAKVIRKSGSWTVEVSGTFPQNSPEKRIGIVGLPDPGLCTARLLSNKTRRKSGLISPSNAILVAPKKIDTIIATMLKESNNLYAEVLLRLCALDGTRELALKALGGSLNVLEISPLDLRIADGSGVSRYNEATPRSIVNLLEIYYSSSNKERMLAALATPGEGTLKGRLIGIKVWAKTGTLLGVSCLSGIVDTPSGMVAFSILMNHLQPDVKRAREIQDAIVNRISRGE